MEFYHFYDTNQQPHSAWSQFTTEETPHFLIIHTYKLNIPRSEVMNENQGVWKLNQMSISIKYPL